MPIIDASQNNVLIDEEGNASVADQGILILCSEFHGTSYVRNNIRWAAPENFHIPEDGESISPKLSSDIYSFACVMLQVCGRILLSNKYDQLLLQTLTGKVPYSEYRNENQVTVVIVKGSKTARPVTPHIEDPLWNFIQSSWLEAERRPLAKDVLKFIQSQLELKVSSGMT